MARAADLYLASYHNHNWHAETNGERWLLSQLPPMTVVYDVGANEGQWARMARKTWPTAEIHCFELIPSTFARLDAPGAILNPFGLSNECGTVKAKSYNGDTGISSLLDYPHLWPSEWIDVPVRRGDDYLGDASVDFLKIDTEGAERFVLEGFDQALTEGRIAVVQFEYARATMLSGWLLRELHGFLAQRGYAVGKLYPKHVAFKDYEYTDDDLRGLNYVAVHNSHPEIIAALL